VFLQHGGVVLCSGYRIESRMYYVGLLYDTLCMTRQEMCYDFKTEAT